MCSNDGRAAWLPNLAMHWEIDRRKTTYYTHQTLVYNAHGPPPPHKDRRLDGASLAPARERFEDARSYDRARIRSKYLGLEHHQTDAQRDALSVRA